MHPALDSMCLQSEIDISYTTVVHVVLVQNIIQALIEVLQVKKDDCSACFHTYLYLVDVSTDLHVITFRENILGHCNSFLRNSREQADSIPLACNNNSYVREQKQQPY